MHYVVVADRDGSLLGFSTPASDQRLQRVVAYMLFLNYLLTCNSMICDTAHPSPVASYSACLFRLRLALGRKGTMYRDALLCTRGYRTCLLHVNIFILVLVFLRISPMKYFSS